MRETKNIKLSSAPADVKTLASPINCLLMFPRFWKFVFFSNFGSEVRIIWLSRLTLFFLSFTSCYFWHRQKELQDWILKRIFIVRKWDTCNLWLADFIRPLCPEKFPWSNQWKMFLGFFKRNFVAKFDIDS